MDGPTYDNLVYGLFFLFGVPCIGSTVFWFVFVATRLFTYYRAYKKLNPNSYQKSSEFNIDLFNYKIKVVIYTFFILLLLSEFVSVLSHFIGMILFQFLIRVNIPLYIITDCSWFSFFELWQAELFNRKIAFCIGLRDAGLCVNLIILIGLLKFIFLAYQRKTNFTSVKRFIITFLIFPPILLVISIFPQTLIVSKVATPVLSIILLILVHKHKKRYYLILKWRCDDLRNEGDTDGYIHNTKIRRNSVISFNILLLALTIMHILLILNKFTSLSLMLLTDHSKYLTAVYNSDLNLAFLDCRYQNILYTIHHILDLVEPTGVLIALILYSIPLIGVSVGFIITVLYSKCRGVDPKYIRFEGNANSM